MDIFLEQEIEKIKVVNENKGYWFIRTYGGEAFEYYVRDGYVGLGFNEVPFRIFWIETSNAVSNMKNFRTA